MEIGPRLRASLVAAACFGAATAGAAPPELLYASEGNRLRRYDIDSIESGGPLVGEVVFENAATDPRAGRDINGTVCALPDGSGRFIAGEDTAQPHPPAGWGVLTPEGQQVGKLTATAYYEKPDPHGCAFDAAGRLFTSETGRQFFGEANGQLIVWFPPFEGFPGEPGAYPDTDATRSNYCKLATDLGTAAGVAVDGAGRVYVAAASGMEVLRFSPPFPTTADAAGGCGARDALGSPRADRVQRERFLGPRLRQGLLTYSGLAMSPRGTLYVASVATGRIGEFELDGTLVRMVLEPPELFPPFSTGYPQGLAVDARGTLYYADLDLVLVEGAIDTGPDGKIWRIPFDPDGSPRTPEIVATGLAFPDGLGVLPGDLGVAAAASEEPAPEAAALPESQGEAPEGPDVPAIVLGLLVMLGIAFGLRSRLMRRERNF